MLASIPLREICCEIDTVAILPLDPLKKTEDVQLTDASGKKRLPSSVQFQETKVMARGIIGVYQTNSLRSDYELERRERPRSEGFRTEFVRNLC